MQKLIRLLCATGILLTVTHRLPAPVLPRSILKSYYERGDKPTQSQFSTLIDSFATETPDGLSIIGIGATNTGSTSFHPATKKYVDDAINALTSFDPIGGPANPIPVMETEFGGQFGFLPLQLTSPSSSGIFYGFFQIRMDDPLAVDPPAIHVDYFAYNTTPDESITAAIVPEPATACLIVAAVVLLRRRQTP